LRNAFGGERVLVIEELRQSNRVAIARTGPIREPAEMSLSSAARRDLAGVFANVREQLAAAKLPA
jgi:hypothetical protein